MFAYSTVNGHRHANDCKFAVLIVPLMNHVNTTFQMEIFDGKKTLKCETCQNFSVRIFRFLQKKTLILPSGSVAQIKLIISSESKGKGGEASVSKKCPQDVKRSSYQ